MSKKIEYKKGEQLGPYNHIYLKEAESYVSPSGKITRQGVFQCSFCNTIFVSRICSIKNGHTKSCGCLNMKKRIERIKKYNEEHPDPWNKKYPDEGEVINEFGVKYIKEGKHEKTPGGTILRFGIFQCPLCGNYFESNYTNVTRGYVSSCGCTKSKGESRIKYILDNDFSDIIYETQKTFKDLYSNKNYPYFYDFYIESLNLLIEYDGIQHYKYKENTTGWNTKEKFLETIANDNIKNKYAKDNNIYLLRIPYTDFDLLSKEYLKEKIHEICSN